MGVFLQIKILMSFLLDFFENSDIIIIENETENEAKNIDNTIKDFLASKDVDFCEIVGNERGYKQICSDIVKKLF